MVEARTEVDPATGEQITVRTAVCAGESACAQVVDYTGSGEVGLRSTLNPGLETKVPQAAWAEFVVAMANGEFDMRPSAATEQ